MDNRVFEDLKSAFRKANQQDGPQVLIFDSAPIKTFIAGANVPAFIQNINRGNFQGIKDDTAKWQDVIFHGMTGVGKPKIAIVDGATFKWASNPKRWPEFCARAARVAAP